MRQGDQISGVPTVGGEGPTTGREDRSGRQLPSAQDQERGEAVLVPHLPDLASPLTDLTRKRAPDTIQWSESCQVSFEAFKTALCGKSVLCAPNFDLPFSLQRDASDRGLGVVRIGLDLCGFTKKSAPCGRVLNLLRY